MPSEPTQQQRADVAARLDDVVEAFLAHPEWKNPPNHNLMLYYIWDFAMRSMYMLSEYDNVKAGRPVLHPAQFQQGAGSGNAAAIRIFQDVCSRTITLNLWVNDTSGMVAMMTGLDYPRVDFGSKVKDAVAALVQVCPEDHARVGMMS